MVHHEPRSNYIIDAQISADIGRVTLQIPPENVAELVELIRLKLTIESQVQTKKNNHNDFIPRGDGSRDPFDASGEEWGNQLEED